MYRFLQAFVLITAVVVASASFAGDGPVCKPKLTLGNVTFSDVQRDTQERRWTLAVAADASRCASTAGYFDLGVVRQKENGGELQFREQFIWSAPTVLVGIDFWWDEAVEDYWVDSIQACPCAD
jgi:hypothetical protein